MKKPFIVIALVMGCLAACDTSSGPSFYKVSEVWAQASELEGKVIAVRGWAGLWVESTLHDCDQSSCSCNTTQGSFSLYEQLGDGGSDLEEIFIPALSCSGDDCSMSCTPFDPTASSAFEFTGTLKALRDQGRISALRLESVDLDASKVLGGADCLCHMQESALDTGKFQVDLKQ